jgi:hypothetical protein
VLLLGILFLRIIISSSSSSASDSCGRRSDTREDGSSTFVLLLRFVAIDAVKFVTR